MIKKIILALVIILLLEIVGKLGLSWLMKMDLRAQISELKKEFVDQGVSVEDVSKIREVVYDKNGGQDSKKDSAISVYKIGADCSYKMLERIDWNFKECEDGDLSVKYNYNNAGEFTLISIIYLFRKVDGNWSIIDKSISGIVQLDTQESDTHFVQRKLGLIKD